MQFQKQKYWIERKFEVQSYDKIFFPPTKCVQWSVVERTGKGYCLRVPEMDRQARFGIKV